MAAEVNGASVLVQVETAPGSGTFITVGSQRNATFTETTAAIDFSSKNSRAARSGPGRYAWTSSFESLYLPSASGYGAIKNAMRNGHLVQIRRLESGTPLESGFAVVTSMSSAFPDQDAAVISIDLQGDGVFNPVV